jgi:NTE family protein
MDARLAAARGAGGRLLALMPGLDRRVGLFETRAMPALVAAGSAHAHQHLAAVQALLRARPTLRVAAA